MNERETERRIRQTIDRGLSGMEADPWLFQRVQRRKEEEPMESHMSMRHRPAGGTLLFRTLGILLVVIIGLGGMLTIRNPIGLSGLFRPVDRVSTQASEQPMPAGQEDSLPAGAVSQTEHSAGSLDRIDLTVDPDLLWNEDYGILAEGPEIDKSSLPFQNATYRKLNQVNQAVEGEMTYTWADSWKDPWHSRILLWTEGDGYTLDMPQKSLGITIEKGCLFFEDRKNAENIFLTLRNAGMDGNYTRLADGVQSRLIEKYSGLKILTLAWRPVSVYLNGEYWGHYNLRENLHDSFMIGQYEKVHVDSSDEAYIVEGLPVSGTYDNLIYQKLMDQLKNSDPANRTEDREYLEQKVDVDSYLNWLALKIYFGDSNAAGSFAAYRLPTGKWKCAAVGFDWGLFRADYNAFESFLKPEGLGAVNADNTIFLKILEIDEYRELFLKKLGGLCQRLTAEVMQAELDQCAAMIAPEMPAHFERWAPSCEPAISPDAPTDPQEALAYWEGRIERMRNGTMQNRPGYVYLQTQVFFGLSDQEMDAYFQTGESGVTRQENQTYIIQNGGFGVNWQGEQTDPTGTVFSTPEPAAEGTQPEQEPAWAEKMEEKSRELFDSASANETFVITYEDEETTATEIIGMHQEFYEAEAFFAELNAASDLPKPQHIPDGDAFLSGEIQYDCRADGEYELDSQETTANGITVRRNHAEEGTRFISSYSVWYAPEDRSSMDESFMNRIFMISAEMAPKAEKDSLAYAFPGTTDVSATEVTGMDAALMADHGTSRSLFMRKIMADPVAYKRIDGSAGYSDQVYEEYHIQINSEILTEDEMKRIFSDE